MTPDFCVGTYAGRDGEPRAGVLRGGRVHDASAVLGTESTIIAMRDGWTETRERLAAWAAGNPEGGVPIEEVRLLAPVQYPANFFCAGANYWDHLAEMAELIVRMTGSAPKTEKAAEPWFFVRTTRGTIVGSDASVRLPGFSREVDWEAELGVVIGTRCKDIDESDALSAVAAYTIVNDLSARDHVKREGSPFIYDWVGQKCWDGSAPMGPWLVPAQFVENPQDLAIELTVNGVVKQSSNTGQMVHSIAEQVAYLSRHVTLYPGDVIATGTPAGVGMPRGDFLKAGDEVRVTIAGLGTLTTKMVA